MNWQMKAGHLVYLHDGPGDALRWKLHRSELHVELQAIVVNRFGTPAGGVNGIGPIGQIRGAVCTEAGKCKDSRAGVWSVLQTPRTVGEGRYRHSMSAGDGLELQRESRGRIGDDQTPALTVGFLTHEGLEG